MGSMTQEQLVQYVINELGKHRSPDDVIKTLAETGAMDWNSAKRFVYGVRAKYGAQIKQKNAPMLVAISLVTMVVGLAIALGIGIATVKGVIIFFIAFPVPWLGNIFYFLFGVFAFIGGLVGILKTATKQA